MTTQEVSAVIQAFDKGKTIQYRQFAIDDTEAWSDCPPKTRFNLNFYSYDYRVKPEPPKPREWWIFPMADGENDVELYELGTQARAVGKRGVIHVREILEETSVVKP